MKKILIISACLFTVLTVIFSALPLGTLALLPIGLALILSFAALKNASTSNQKLPKILLAITVLSLLFVLGKELLIKEEVAKDDQFEKVIEQSKTENKKDLEALENELE